MKGYIKKTWKFYRTAVKGMPSPPLQKRKENTKQTHKTTTDAKGKEKDVLWKQWFLWLMLRPG